MATYTGQDGRVWNDISADTTLTAADSGVVQNVVADGKVITLPATSAGASYVIRNGGVATGPAGAVSDGTVLVSVAVASGDGFTGGGFTAAINKKALNTKATSKVGDEIRIIGSGSNTAAAWKFEQIKGTWAREA